LGSTPARRVVSLLITGWLATLVVFTALDVVPGDPARVMLGTEAREDTVAALRTQMGLDAPAPERYLRFVAGLVVGDLGTSLTDGRPVGGMIAEAAAITLPLALGSLVFSALIGVPLGLAAAGRRGEPDDWLISAFGRIGVAIPGFWMAILLILLFAVEWKLFPAGGFPGWDAGVGPALSSLALPVAALAIPEAAILARVVRAAALDQLGEDYVRTARAKGRSWTGTLTRHVLPNAVVPVATLLGLQFAHLIAGAVVVENVFHLPGLGRMIHQAIGRRDLVVVRDVGVILVFLVILIGFLVDMIVWAIDRRPRRG